MIPQSIYPESDAVTHTEMASAIRVLAMDAVEAANSGHPGMPMGMADVATVLFTKFLKFDPKHPTWPDRDRFVLSAGHGSMLLYALLYLTGYKKMPLEELKKFRQLHSHAAGHPEVLQDAGIEMTTGPLGQGISSAVGMALAERMLNARFGDALTDHYTYVIASDGDLMEGISHEACSLAGHLNLKNLIVLYDDNDISIDGPTSLSFSDNTKQRFEAYGWQVWQVDGHNPALIEAALYQARECGKPALICCKTQIGYGAPTKAKTASSHGSPLGADEILGARKHYNWVHEPFDIPDRILNMWHSVGTRGETDYQSWQKQYQAAPATRRQEFDDAMNGIIKTAAWDKLTDYKKQVLKDKPSVATRATSGQVLECLVPLIPELTGGSADLSGSNLTKTKSGGIVSRSDFSGRYIHYGVREHGMAAIMNGLALHGGFIPYGGTFLVFADYCRPSIRLSALMEQQVIYIMTHDSIGLGEDGPTHQPIEHLASLRAIPNLLVFRPCDAIETAEAWEVALKYKKGPSLFALSRQNLPTVCESATDNKTAWGAYVLKEAMGTPQITLMATGSEVSLALGVQEILQNNKLRVRVVSAPCLDLFDQQDKDYQNSILPPDNFVVGIEAASSYGWARYTGRDGLFFGIDSFGASGPYQELYQHFGLTAPAIATAVRNKFMSLGQ